MDFSGRGRNGIRWPAIDCGDLRSIVDREHRQAVSYAPFLERAAQACCLTTGGYRFAQLGFVVLIVGGGDF